MHKLVLQGIVLVLLIFISFHHPMNPFKSEKITTFSTIQQVMKEEDPLYIEIKQRSASFKIPPQNAVIDKVWKKIPGLNGRKVDVEKSYEKMKKAGEFNKNFLVFNEISPKVSLNELPPAPIYRGNANKRMVSLLINVSWGTEHIPAILKILKEHQVKATFFVEGKWAKDNAKYVKMIDEQGHVIGNHAYNHPDMARISEQEIHDQLKSTNNTIQAIIGKKPTLFAPPSGSFTNQVVSIADSYEMNTILWTVDTIDWKNPSVSVMMNRVIPKLHPGATILMHPTEAIVRGLDELIIEIKEKDYQIGTVEKLLSENRLSNR